MMPMGLSGAPECFQRVMESIREDVMAAVLIYLDDLILCGLDEITHLKEIDQFLSVIIRYGLTLKIEKCRFAQEEIKYLGFLISHQGTRIDPRNLEAVKRFTRPK